MGIFKRPTRAVSAWHPSRLTVHPGIQGRLTLRIATDELAHLADGDASSWARELPAIRSILELPPADPTSSSRFLVFGSAGEEISYEPPLSHRSTLSEVEEFVRGFWDEVLAWARAGLDAGAFEARMVKRALNTASVSYAFGTHAEAIAVDSLASQDQRDAADAVLAELLGIPGLDHWHSRPQVAHLQHRDDSSARLNAGAPPALTGGSWWASSRIPMPVWIAYDQEAADAFEEDPSLISDDALDLMGRTREQYAAELERERENEVPVESTAEVYGDDAGDLPIDHPAKMLRKLRLYELTDADSVRALALRYPAVLDDPEAGSIYDNWAGLDAPINLAVNWHELAKDYDGVRYTIPAAMELAYVPVVVESTQVTGTAMLVGWTPGSTIYFVDPAER